MRRDVYLFEFENMSFKERLYYVRNNEWRKDWTGYTVENPLDWSIRKLWRAWIKIITVPVWWVVYWPLMLYGAYRLKKQYANYTDPTVYISNCEVLR